LFFFLLGFSWAGLLDGFDGALLRRILERPRP
jgi:hypothetical protein